MNSFENNPIHKQPKEEHSEEAIEKSPLPKEKLILERFRGRAGEVARAMMLVSTLVVGSGITKEAHAQESDSPTKTEQVKQEEQKLEINEANITTSSKWSGDIVESARNDMSKIKTPEDAEWLVRSHFNKFVSEYYMPTTGDLEEGPYGTKIRNYTEDDSKFLLQNAQEMKELLQEINEKFSVEAYKDRTEQVDDIITKLERKLSYAGQKQNEALKQLERILQQR